MKTQVFWKLFLGAVTIVAVIGGITACYWTSDSSDTAISLEIIRERGVTSQAFMEPEPEPEPEPEHGTDGFLYIYVIDEAVMFAGEEALDELFAGMDDPLYDYFDLTFDTEEEFQAFLNTYKIDIDFPAAQIQGGVIPFGIGESGSNTFRGLNADSSYLVIAWAEDVIWDPQTGGLDWTTDAIGYRIVTVRSGQTRTVKLELGDKWNEFYTLLVERYGWAEYTYDFDPFIVIYFDTPLTEPVYFDLLEGTTPDATTGSRSGMETWYQESAIVVDSTGSEIDKVGSRQEIPADTWYVAIEGIEPDREWRVLLTSWQDRATVPSFEKIWLSSTISLAINDHATLVVGENGDFVFGSWGS